MDSPNRSGHCPQCGKPLPVNAPHGICPPCLLQVGLGTASKISGSVSSSAMPTGDHGAQPTGAPFPLPSPTDLTPLLPQLEVDQLIGWGGMGAVYRARQVHLDRLVALKIIRPEVVGDPAFAERFYREARLLARLNHPHIVTIYDFGKLELAGTGAQQPNRPLYYFVMEFVNGTDLRQLIQKQKLSPQEALAIVPQICEALQYAHDEGVVHRDIKPENILINERGHVKIADFGLAKLAANPDDAWTLTGTHQVMGTPRYMAPEQIEGFHQVDHRADIYSLGVVLYELLTGQLPLGHFEPPSQKVQVDVRLDEVVLRAMARDPARRYQHASDVKCAVEAVHGGRSATPTASSTETWPPSVAATQPSASGLQHETTPQNSATILTPTTAAEWDEQQRAIELAEIAPESDGHVTLGLFTAAWAAVTALWNYRWPGVAVGIALLIGVTAYTMQRKLKFLPRLHSELAREPRWYRALCMASGLGVLAIALLCWLAAAVSLGDSLTSISLSGLTRYTRPTTDKERMDLAKDAGFTNLADDKLSTSIDTSYGFEFSGPKAAMFLIRAIARS